MEDPVFEAAITIDDVPSRVSFASPVDGPIAVSSSADRPPIPSASLPISRSGSVFPMHTVQLVTRRKPHQKKRSLVLGLPYYQQIQDVENKKNRRRLKSAAGVRRKSPGRRTEEGEDAEGMKKAVKEGTQENKKLERRKESLKQQADKLRDDMRNLESEQQEKIRVRWKSLLAVTEGAKNCSYEKVKKLKEELANLTKSRKELENSLKEAVEERNRLRSIKVEIIERHRLSFQADLDKTKPRPLTDLLSLLWSGFLSDSDIDRKFLKKDLKSLFFEKRREEIEDILSGYNLNFTKRELKLMLAKHTIGGRFNGSGFVDELSEYQPYPFFEDLQSQFQAFRLRVSVLNWSKSRFQSYLNVGLPRKPMKSKGVSLLISPPIALLRDIAEPIIAYLWKGKDRLDCDRVDLGEIDEWELASDVIARVRLQCVSNNVKLEQAEEQLRLGVPLGRLFSLSEEQLSVFEASLRAPGASLLSILGPAWKVEREISITKQFQELSNCPSMKEYVEIALRATTLSNGCISLHEFLSEWEAQLQKLTEDQRTAIEVFAYKETNQIDSLPITAFLGMIFKFTLLDQQNDKPVIPPQDEGTAQIFFCT